MRNAYFLPSGFETQEIINLIEARGDNKERLTRIKERKRAEQKLHKQAKHNNEHKLYDRIIQVHKLMTGEKIRINKRTDQIQYGVDLAKWWNEQHE